MRKLIKIGDAWGEWRDRLWFEVRHAGDNARAFDMVHHFHSKTWVTDKIIADFVRAVAACRRQAFRDKLAA